MTIFILDGKSAFYAGFFHDQGSRGETSPKEKRESSVICVRMKVQIFSKWQNVIAKFTNHSYGNGK